MARDPKQALVGSRRRLLTIHDGARVTPALVRLLDVLATEVDLLLEAGADTEYSGRDGRAKATPYKLERLDPVLVSRSDGLAIYVDWAGYIA